MARPILRINGHDYTEYVEEMTPSSNDLDADGSGRDIQTGEMFRTKITDKQKWTVKMLRLPEDVHTRLASDLREQYYSATVLDPETNSQQTKTFYTSSRPFGVQRYNKRKNTTYYDGMQFNMTER